MQHCKCGMKSLNIKTIFVLLCVFISIGNLFIGFILIAMPTANED